MAPPKSPNPKNHTVSFKVTQAEFERIHTDRGGRSLTDFLRAKVLGRKNA